MFDRRQQLLVACARPVPAHAGQMRIRELLQSDIDWAWLLEQADWHCVSALLLANLEAAAPDRVPPGVLQALRSRFDHNFRHNLFLSGRMLQMVRSFEARNIRVIAYKGPVLCTYYSNIGLREFGDLDFLVAPQDVAAAHEMLLADGFHPHLYKPCAQEPRTLPFARAFHYEMVYANRDGNVKVDLHWALMPGFWRLPRDAREVWERLQVCSAAGGPVPTLSHEDTLLLLCAHGSKHMWRSLGWICDVAALLHSVPALDWPNLFLRASQFRVQRALGLGLFLASDLMSAAIPPEASRRIQEDPEIGRLAASVRNGVFADHAVEDGVLESSWFLMRTRENLRDALRCGFDRIFRPTMAEWQSIALPRPLFPTYYFLRLVRLLTKHGLRN